MPRKNKTITIECTVSEAVLFGLFEISSLREEMDEWRGNMDSNNMGHLPKYDEVSEVCDALSGVPDDIDVPEHLAENGVSYPITTKNKMPRWMRLENALSALGAVKDRADQDEDDRDEGSSEFADEISDAMGCAEGVEFPSAFG